MSYGLLPPLFSRLRDQARQVKQERQARARLQGSTRLHLGCGPNVLAGWANLDQEGSSEVILHDLTRPLPVASNTIDYVYSEHFIEHIPQSAAIALASECLRVLRPGGVFRLSTPDLRKLIAEYQSGRIDEWADVGWRPSTPCAVVNEGLRNWGHQYVYDAADLTLLLQNAGFRDVVPVGWKESRHEALRNLECRPFHQELIFEATRP